MARMRLARPPPWRAIATSTLILVVAFALKQHFSHAGPDSLAWVLGPTVGLVELLTGVEFEVERGVGYFARTEMFAITKSCAGVNFLIVSFSMLGLAWTWGGRPTRVPLLAVGLAAGLAFSTTIVANAIRITVALPLSHTDYDPLGMSGADVHRFVGVVVYFGALLILYRLFVVRRSASRPGRLPPWTVWLLPLAFYVSVTLVVPLLNGWLRGRPLQWGEHTTVLLLLPAAMIVVVLVGAAGLRALARRRRGGPGRMPGFVPIEAADFPPNVSRRETPRKAPCPHASDPRLAMQAETTENSGTSSG